MTQIQKEGWNRTLTLAGSIGIPLVSIAFWLIVSGTKLVDKVEAIGLKQNETEKKLDHVINRVDTIEAHQRDEAFIRKYTGRYSLK